MLRLTRRIVSFIAFFSNPLFSRNLPLSQYTQLTSSHYDTETQHNKRGRRLPSTTTYSANSHDPISTETTLERLRRLRSAVQQLEDDVCREQALQVVVAPIEGDENGKGKGKKREVSAAVVLQQLMLLRNDLGALPEGKEGESGPVSLEQKLKSSEAFLSRKEEARVEEVVGDVARVEGSVAMKDDAGMLETRLSLIENLVGARESDISDVRPPPLLPLTTDSSTQSNPLPPPLLKTLHRLETLLLLLTQPRHLDTISRRIKVLVVDLERLAESRKKLGDTRPLHLAVFSGASTGTGGGLTVVTGGAGGEGKKVLGSGLTSGGGEEGISPEALSKISALYALLPRIDPLLPLTPRLLTRLRSLSTLHSSAQEFSTTLSSLQSSVASLGETGVETKAVLEQLEGSLKENEELVKGNLAGLEGRIRAVGERLGRLGM